MKVYIAFFERMLVTDKVLWVFTNIEDAELAVRESEYRDFKGYVIEYEVIE